MQSCGGVVAEDEEEEEFQTESQDAARCENFRPRHQYFDIFYVLINLRFLS